MDHTQAIELKAVERYLLEDLSGKEREAFEEHAFVCPVCANELKLGYYFRENGRAVTAEIRAAEAASPARKSPHGASGGWMDRLRPWFQLPSLVPSMCALGLLAVVAVQQNEMRKPRLYSEQAVALRGVVREGDAPVQVSADKAATLSGDFVLGGEFTWQLKNSSGQVLADSNQATLLQGGKFHLGTAPLPTGSYTLVLTNPASGQSANYRFDAVKK